MSIIDEIKSAKVNAAERAVIENLRRKGLIDNDREKLEFTLGEDGKYRCMIKGDKGQIEVKAPDQKTARHVADSLGYAAMFTVEKETEEG